MKSENAVGIEEGEKCNRDGCQGIIGIEPVENCSCHISPPCHKCVNNPIVCLKCGAEIDFEVTE